MKRPLAALLGILLVLSICVGCGPKGDISSGVAEQDFPVTVNEVTIQDEPKGVVVLSPNLQRSLWRSATRCNLWQGRCLHPGGPVSAAGYDVG
ncbi:MAG: hypothetical protein ACLS8R_07005 [Anaeromassilibacillus sp.]